MDEAGSCGVQLFVMCANSGAVVNHRLCARYNTGGRLLLRCWHNWNRVLVTLTSELHPVLVFC